MSEFKIITIVTTKEKIVIRAKYKRDLERPNWHYYELDDGSLFHVRKDHMVSVHEEAL